MVNPFLKLWRDDRGQDAFEYLLVTAGFAVLLYLSLLAFDQFSPSVVSHSCSSVNTAAAEPDQCVTPTP